MGVVCVCVCVCMCAYVREAETEKDRDGGEKEKESEKALWAEGTSVASSWQLAGGSVPWPFLPSLASGQLSSASLHLARLGKEPEPGGENDVAEVKLSFWPDLNK